MSKERIARKVKVWNRATTDYEQVVMGEKVLIPAGKYITKSRREGIAIRGHYPGKGVSTKIELEPIIEEVEVTETFVDHRTGMTFPTRELLLKHLGLDPEEVDRKNKAPTYVCGLCETSFRDKDALVKHMTDCITNYGVPKDKAVATAKK